MLSSDSENEVASEYETKSKTTTVGNASFVKKDAAEIKIDLAKPTTATSAD